MRRIGHVLPVEGMKSLLEYSRDEVEGFPADREQQIARRNWEFFTGYLEMALWYAALGYLFDEPLDRIVRMLRDAVREWPAVYELDGVLNAGEMREFLAATVLAGDRETRDFATAIPRKRYTDPDGVASPVAYSYVKLLQAVARGHDAEAAAALKEARENLGPGKLIVKPRWESRYFGTVLALAEAVLGGGQAAFDRAWQERERFYHAEFSKPAEAGNVEGILDWQALALGRLALERGLRIERANPYAPGELLQAAAAA
jgi:hypothetical protein